MPDSCDNPHAFIWQPFVDAITQHPFLLGLILERLGRGGWRLRGVDKTMRRAVNRAVTSLQVDQRDRHPTSDLQDVFPKVRQLEYHFVDRNEPSDEQPPDHAGLWINNISTASPLLMSNLKVLKIVGEEYRGMGRIDLLPNLLQLLPRCTSLVTLEVHEIRAFKAAFQGQGQTLAQQRSSLQQQIEAILIGSSISAMAPASWPVCQCLTAFELGYRYRCVQPLPLQMLDAALHTASLMDLRVTIDALSAAALKSLHQFSTLTKLTQVCLHLHPAQSPAAWQLLLTAAAQLAKLQRLTVTGSQEGAASQPASAGSCLDLSRLFRLTHLEVVVEGLRLDLQRLSGARSLRSLRMTPQTIFDHDKWPAYGSAGVGCLASLFDLTALTSLDGPLTLEAALGLAGATSAEAPDGWRQGLLSLRWPAASDWGVLAVVAQLTSLTRLGLKDVCVSPELCSMLGELPQLAKLFLRRTTVPAHLPSPPPPYQRPTLPALAFVHLDKRSMAALHVLARWTQVSASCAVSFGWLPALSVVETCTLAVKGWSKGWLHAVLKQAYILGMERIERDADEFEPPAGFVLVDDADVEALLEAAGPVGPEQCCSARVPLVLGEAVSPEALALLVPAYCWSSLVLYDLLAEMAQPYVSGWTGSLALTPDYFPALAAGHFRGRLRVQDCSLLDDHGAERLVAAAPHLQDLHLGRAGQLTDEFLRALCAGNKELTSLKLAGVQQVTAVGVLPLLLCHSALRSVEITMVPVEGEEAEGVASAALELIPNLLALCPGVDDDWDMQQNSNHLLFSSLSDYGVNY